MLVCACTCKVTLKTKDVHTMNEVGSNSIGGAEGGEGLASGPHPDIRLPAISLRELPFKALRG